MMRVVVRGSETGHAVFDLPAGATCAQLHQRIESLRGAPAAFIVAHAGRPLAADACPLADAGLNSPAVVSLLPVLAGGGAANKNQMDPAFQALADSYNVQKKVCRRCYATTHAKAFTCRKRKCGRCADLRPKKLGDK